MRTLKAAFLTLVFLALVSRALGAQAPTAADVLKGMGLPSTATVRGQKDTLGYATTASQMAQVWDLAARPPFPESFGQTVQPGVLGAICPHDDYLYAGRVYRRVIPLVTARTVVLVGTFHAWRRFGAKEVLVMDSRKAWRSPDGEIPVSVLREALKAALPAQDTLTDDRMHDGEHSLEAVAYWLRHQRPDLEILPLMVPMAGFDKLEAMAARTGEALADLMKARGLVLGRDVAVVISSDGVHYGEDFHHTPFGAGGVEAYQLAAARDRSLLAGPLNGPVNARSARAFFETCVDPKDPGTYRVTWCGRYAVPFGMLMLKAAAGVLDQPGPVARPVALSFTVDTPELPVRALGLGSAVPASLYHFVGTPAVAFTAR